MRQDRACTCDGKTKEKQNLIDGPGTWCWRCCGVRAIDRTIDRTTKYLHCIRTMRIRRTRRRKKHNELYVKLLRSSRFWRKLLLESISSEMCDTTTKWMNGEKIGRLNKDEEERTTIWFHNHCARTWKMGKTRRQEVMKQTNRKHFLRYVSLGTNDMFGLIWYAFVFA